MSKSDKEKNLSYEEAVEKLEEIVKKMESGNLLLSESVKAYEEGIKLIRYCEEELNKYEKLISSLGKGEGADVSAEVDIDE